MVRRHAFGLLRLASPPAMSTNSSELKAGGDLSQSESVENRSSERCSSVGKGNSDRNVYFLEPAEADRPGGGKSPVRVRRGERQSRGTSRKSRSPSVVRPKLGRPASDFMNPSLFEDLKTILAADMLRPSRETISTCDTTRSHSDSSPGQNVRGSSSAEGEEADWGDYEHYDMDGHFTEWLEKARKLQEEAKKKTYGSENPWLATAEAIQGGRLGLDSRKEPSSAKEHECPPRKSGPTGWSWLGRCSQDSDQSTVARDKLVLKMSL
mmetsp:Transcript_20948/g.72282  ORF Transcript_20948/g.72282 Transcript_20948/m.72282 type:complete len:266 (-) Transcript_20948:210-1007(-)